MVPNLSTTENRKQIIAWKCSRDKFIFLRSRRIWTLLTDEYFSMRHRASNLVKCQINYPYWQIRRDRTANPILRNLWSLCIVFGCFVLDDFFLFRLQASANASLVIVSQRAVSNNEAIKEVEIVKHPINKESTWSQTRPVQCSVHFNEHFETRKHFGVINYLSVY